jgi:hypothetical protein
MITIELSQAQAWAIIIFIFVYFVIKFIFKSTEQ